MKTEVKKIDDLLPDPNNVNRHTQRGHGLVENSIRRRGVGRGILAAGKNTDKPVIMAGNLTHEKARDAGIDEVVFVHTTGNQLVVTVRDDLDPTSPEAIALGIEDNEAGKLSYNPDIDLLAAMSAGDNGVLSKLKEDDKIFGDMLAGMGAAAEGAGFGGSIGRPQQRMAGGVGVVGQFERDDRVGDQMARDAAGWALARLGR